MLLSNRTLFELDSKELKKSVERAAEWNGKNCFDFTDNFPCNFLHLVDARLSSCNNIIKLTLITAIGWKFNYTPQLAVVPHS